MKSVECGEPRRNQTYNPQIDNWVSVGDGDDASWVLNTTVTCKQNDSEGGGWGDVLLWLATRLGDVFTGTTALDNSDLYPSGTRRYTPAPIVEAGVDAVAVLTAVIIGGKIAGAEVGGLLAAGAATSSTTNVLKRAAVSAVNRVGAGRGPAYGTKVRTAFRDEIRALGRNDLRPEVSFRNGVEVDYGFPGSVRLDAVQFDGAGNVIGVWDLKTGGAVLTSERALAIFHHLPPGPKPPIVVIRPYPD